MNMTNSLFTRLFCCLLLLPAIQSQAQDKPALAPEVYTRSLVSQGNTVRLQKVLAKALSGQGITVAVIGGSITQGAKATKPQYNYGSRVAQWWRTTFPQTKVQFVNAGIGATGSNYGALRAQPHLLSHHPDFVVVEYAVNDNDSQASAESLEGLIRQILKQPQHPAVVLLFMMHQGGGNAQAWFTKVGTHYHLPMISYRDALWPEIEAKHIKWEDVEADTVHPNDYGHSLAAEFVTRFLEQIRQKTSTGDVKLTVPAIAQPLFGEVFEHVSLFDAPDLKPLTNKGWVLDAATKSWKSSTPGSVIEFAIKGTVLLDMHYRIKGPMGHARVQVDDRPPMVQEAWFDQTWGGYRVTSELGRGLKLGLHRVKFELLAEKNPGSTGNEFRILGLGAAGVTP